MCFISQAASITVITLALLSLFSTLTTLPGIITAHPIKSFILLLTGLGLWGIHPRHENPSKTTYYISLLALVLSLILALSYLFNWSTPPTSLSVYSAISLLLISLALMLTHTEKPRQILYAQLLSGIVIMSAITILLSAYANTLIEDHFPYQFVDIYTSIVILLLGFGTFIIRPDKALMHIMTDDGPGSTIGRYLMPAILALPLLLAWVFLLGERAKLYDMAFGITLLIVTLTVTLVMLIFLSAAQLNQAETKRRKIGKELAENQDRLTRIINSAMDAIITINEKHEIIIFNQAAEGMFQYPAAEIIGQPLNRLIPANFHQTHGHHIHSFSQTNITNRRMGETLNVKGLRANGEEFPIESAISQVEYDGQCYFTVILRDISEYQRTEQALSDSEERFRNTFEQAAVGIAHVSIEGQFIRLNQRFSEITGYSIIDLLNKTFQEITHADDLADDQQHIDQLLNGSKTTYSVEKRYLHKTGSPVWVKLTASLVQDSNGVPRYFIKVIEDISSQKQAQLDLQASEERYRRIIETVQEGLWIINEDNKTTYVNQKMADLLGYTRYEMLSLPVPTFLAEQDHNLPGQNPPGQRDVRFLHRDNTEIWALVSTTPLFDSNNNYQGSLSMVTDITQRIEMENQLRQLNEELEARVDERTAHLTAVNRELEAFSYSVSHDLRAPLRSIDGFSQAILEDYADQLDDEGQGYLRRIRAASQRMGHLIDDLIQLSRITRGNVHFEPVNLSEIVHSVVQTLQETDPKRTNVQVIIQHGLTDEGDARLLQVMFENLVNNAWKFTQHTAEPVIEFGQTEINDEKVYFVRDNGAGFDMRYAEKLFGAFQRLHDTVDFEGTGIGLATCMRIIHRHGGKIWAEAAVNKGATFFFNL